MIWSREQKRIIDADCGNLLASASAGSGKTTVMLERVRRLIVEKHVPVRRIVMLSFNKAIAKEIRIRLIEMLEKEVIAHPELATEIDSIETAPITTIDGFCNGLVNEYFEKLDIGADCKILEGTAQQTMLNGVIVNTVKQLKAESDPKIYGMIDKFGGEKKLIQAIAEAYGFACVVPNREEWLANACLPAQQEDYDAICRRYIEVLNKRHSAELKAAADLLCELEEKSSPYVILQTLINALADILGSCEYNDLYRTKQAYAPLLGGRLNFKKEAPYDIDYAKKFINLMRDNVKKIFDTIVYDNKTAYAGYEQSHNDSAELARYALLAHDSFTELKRAMGVLDFADMTYYAAKLLQDDALSEEIAAKYDYIFIDEYQDTNYIGEFILSRISRDNLFMVGDAKQSIYGFRLAEPQIMLDKIMTMTVDDSVNKRSRQLLTYVNLNDNYRADAKILEFINGIFDVIMTKNYGGIEYRTTDRFVAKAKYEQVSELPHCHVTWVFVPKPDKTLQKSLLNNDIKTEDACVYNPFEDKAIGKDDSAAIAEGKYIAAVIKQLVGRNIYDVKSQSARRIEYEDICILSRYCIANGNRVDKTIKTVEAEGIAVSTDGLIKREEAEEVTVIIEMLKVIDNDTQEIPLACALKSVWCGMTSSELADLRRTNIKTSFYALIAEQRGKNKKISRMYDIIEELRKRLAYHSVYDIVCALVYEFGYDKKLIADKGNIGCVRDYIAGLRGYDGSLSEFVNTATLRFDVVDQGDNSGKNRVKAMTIHASKGLEFPVVILMGADEKFHKLNSGVVTDKNYGIAVDCFDEDRMVKSDNFILKILKSLKSDKEMDEEMRLFYVAMTRAKNHLLITGAVSENNLAIDEYTAPYNVSCYKEWIGNAVKEGSIPRKFIEISEVSHEVSALESIANDVIDIAYAANEIERVIGYEYPYALSTQLGLKHTVTELIAPDTYEDIPIFGGFYDDDSDKAARGTNYHVILEHIDYSAISEEGVRSELKRMVKENLIDEGALETVNVNEIVKLMNSEIIAEARAENAIYMREKQFMLRSKACDFYDCDSDDEILIQGAIDLIIDAERLTVVDFKKSRKSRDGLISTYARQLDIYARAVEKAMGRRVDRKIIYEIGRGEIIEL